MVTHLLQRIRRYLSDNGAKEHIPSKLKINLQSMSRCLCNIFASRLLDQIHPHAYQLRQILRGGARVFLQPTKDAFICMPDANNVVCARQLNFERIGQGLLRSETTALIFPASFSPSSVRILRIAQE